MSQRKAQIRVAWTASGKETLSVDVPDHLHPDEVEGWLESHAPEAEFDPYIWDDLEAELDEVVKIEGKWEPAEDHPRYAEWIEHQKRQPGPGQRDIFGGEHP